MRYLNGASIALYILWIQGIAALLWGETVMFIYSWKVSLFVWAILPLGMIAFVFQFQIQFIPPTKSSKYTQQQSTMISDSIMNHETLASLAYEEECLNKYELNPSSVNNIKSDGNKHIAKTSALILAIIFGLS